MMEWFHGAAQNKYCINFMVATPGFSTVNWILTAF